MLGLLLALQACGYQFTDSRNLPSGVRAIAVDVLANRTRLSGLEVEMTNALVSEFTSRHQAMIADNDRAEAVLSGAIRHLNTDVVSRSSTMQVRVRQVTLIVALALKDNRGAILWRNDELSAIQTYAVSDNEIITEANRRAAISRAVQRVAEYAYLQMVQMFWNMSSDRQALSSNQAGRSVSR